MFILKAKKVYLKDRLFIKELYLDICLAQTHTHVYTYTVSHPVTLKKHMQGTCCLNVLLWLAIEDSIYEVIYNFIHQTDSTAHTTLQFKEISRLNNYQPLFVKGRW